MHFAGIDTCHWVTWGRASLTRWVGSHLLDHLLCMWVTGIDTCHSATWGRASVASRAAALHKLRNKGWRPIFAGGGAGRSAALLSGWSQAGWSSLRKPSTQLSPHHPVFTGSGAGGEAARGVCHARGARCVQRPAAHAARQVREAGRCCCLGCCEWRLAVCGRDAHVAGVQSASISNTEVLASARCLLLFEGVDGTRRGMLATRVGHTA